MKDVLTTMKKSWIFPKELGQFWYLNSTFVIFATGLWSKGMLEWSNYLEVQGKEILENLALKRPKDQPLITVSNHTSCLDEPCLWGLLNLRLLTKARQMRWTLGAKELLYTNRLYSWYFSHGKVIPVIRGSGVYQRAMDFALEQLNNGGWVHVFPEGKVNLTGTCMRLKWGVGRLIAECKKEPVVLPFWHVGMDDFLPNRSPYIPQFRKNITVLVDEPIEVNHVLQTCKENNYSKEESRKIITDLIQDRFADLRPRANRLHSQRLKASISS